MAKIDALASRLSRSRPLLSRAGVRDLVYRLDLATVRHVRAIVERDAMPHLSHLINGWGNAKIDGKTLLSETRWFIQQADQPDKSFFLQCDQDGDFHPWQTFAYCFMAGVSPTTHITPAQSIRDLALRSINIQTSDGEELGHLLFCLPYLMKRPGNFSVALNKTEYSFSRLTDHAVEAHAHGHFNVCRKFHLTEGLTQIVRHFPEAAMHRTTVESFFEGQVNQIYLLALISEILAEFRLGKLDRLNELEGYRATLAIGDLFENFLYYIGHLVELACFGHANGFQVVPSVRFAINQVLNELQYWFPRHIHDVDIPTCAHCLSHFRRAITMYLGLSERSFATDMVNRRFLSGYTADFDLLRKPADPPPQDSPKIFEGNLSPFRTLKAARTMRPRFEEVVSTYNNLRGKLPEARGLFDHFQRIIPKGWPRFIHFEFLDKGAHVGLELHLESDLVSELGGAIKCKLNRPPAKFELPWEWDQSWSRGRGRLRSVADDSLPPQFVAKQMIILINHFVGKLNPAVSMLLKRGQLA